MLLLIFNELSIQHLKDNEKIIFLMTDTSCLFYLFIYVFIYLSFHLFIYLCNYYVRLNLIFEIYILK